MGLWVYVSLRSRASRKACGIHVLRLTITAGAVPVRVGDVEPAGASRESGVLKVGEGTVTVAAVGWGLGLGCSRSRDGNGCGSGKGGTPTDGAVISACA